LTKHFNFLFRSKDEILVQKTTTSLHEKKTGWRQWALIFCVEVHMALTPSPVRRRPPKPDRVDVINAPTCMCISYFFYIRCYYITCYL